MIFAVSLLVKEIAIRKLFGAFLRECGRSLVLFSIRMSCLLKKLFKIWNIIVTMNCWNTSYFIIIINV